MEDPTKSIFWSSLFLGNGQGRVVNGPFANWTTPSEGRYLQRNIGLSRSSLINATSIQNVFRKRYNSEILTPTAARDIDNLERHHDSVHVWIGGHMGGTPSSPQDPVFFLHHCFIDYLWEIFRQRQIQEGINPETDYPSTSIPDHQPNRYMDNLRPQKRNIEGYSNDFTNNIYEYDRPPSCPYCGGGQYLQCNGTINRCQAVTRSQFLEGILDEPTRIFQERPLQLLPSELFIARLFDPSSGCGGGEGGGNGGGSGGGGGECGGGGGGGWWWWGREKRSTTFEHNGNIISSCK